MATVNPFSPETIEVLSGVLADTHEGLTGSEIGRLLVRCRIEDPQPEATKRHRLGAALRERQSRDRSGNCIVAFIHAVMNPVRYTSEPNRFDRLRQELNAILGFEGLSLGEDGKRLRSSATRTLSEAARRANRLRTEMLRRGVHGQVLAYCRDELVADDCFDAVFEAVKGLGDRIRGMSGLAGDGAGLVQAVFATGRSGLPVFALNALRTVSERSEQTGLVNLMTGVFGAFRNPAAHEPKAKWHITEQDALDLLTTLSLIHRRLDRAVPTAPMSTVG